MTQPIDPIEPHANLLIVAQTLLTMNNYQVELTFVWGHQDNGHPTILTQDAWLNVKANLLAKAKVSAAFMSPSHFKLPSNCWGCYTGNKCIVAQLQPSLCQFINRNTTLSYWGKQKQCSYNQLQEIDWLSLGQAMQSIPLLKCWWASKQMSSHFAHGKNMVQWKQCTSAECPRCGIAMEDKPHIVKCPQEQVTTKWNEAIAELTKWMKEMNSAPHLLQAMVDGLQVWQQDNQFTDDSPAP